MKILLIGREGQLAWELRRTLACLGEVIALDRHTLPVSLDLSDADSIRSAVDATRPALIVNAGAYTAVDQAETDSQAAYKINAVAPGILAEEARKLGAGLIHYSTDYVFPGDATRPYREDDSTGPQSVYGKSKLEGELAIAQVGADHYIFRTAWVYGLRGRNFLLTMLRLMREREELGVVDDQLGAPTWSRAIAEASALVIASSLQQNVFAPRERSGIYHMTSEGHTSWCGFSQAIREMGLDKGMLQENCARVKPIASSAYPTPAKRPAYSVLCNGKLSDTFGIQLPHWREALSLCLETP